MTEKCDFIVAKEELQKRANDFFIRFLRSNKDCLLGHTYKDKTEILFLEKPHILSKSREFKIFKLKHSTNKKPEKVYLSSFSISEVAQRDLERTYYEQTYRKNPQQYNCYRDSYLIAKEIFQNLEISAHTPLMVEFSYAYEWKDYSISPSSYKE